MDLRELLNKLYIQVGPEVALPCSALDTLLCFRVSCQFFWNWEAKKIPDFQNGMSLTRRLLQECILMVKLYYKYEDFT